MKKTITLLCAAFISLTLSAQNADIKKAANLNKSHTSVKATVTQTRHNVALTDDTKMKGQFYYNKKGSLSIDFASNKEMLLAVQDEFTMVKSGKKRTVKATSNAINPYKVLSEVFACVYTGQDDATLKSVANVSYSTQSNVCAITATPKPSNDKQAKRAMYSKFVASVNLKTGEVTRITIYDKKGNYMQYDFSAYSYNAKFDSSTFTAKYVKKQ